MSKDNELFHVYQKELDERNDRHERVVKCSRDITIESKKIIFLLHRYTSLKDGKEKSDLLSTAKKRISDVRRNQMLKVAKEMSYVKDQFMHNRAITFGIQEHIEVSAFYAFLSEQRLLTYEELQALLTFEVVDADGSLKNYYVEVTPSDYLLGLSDVGGELMRFAINQYSTGDTLLPTIVIQFMRILYEGFLLQDPLIQHRDFGQKLVVFRQSLMKVENLLYVQKLRDLEFGDGVPVSLLMPDVD